MIDDIPGVVEEQRKVSTLFHDHIFVPEGMLECHRKRHLHNLVVRPGHFLHVEV